MIRILHGLPEEVARRETLVALLLAGLGESGRRGWEGRDAVRAELAAFDGPERVSLVAEAAGEIVGWAGAIREGPGRWQLHGLVVDAPYRGRGVGSRLLEAIEEEAWRRGVLTLWLGSDDDYGGTNIFGVDVYADIPGAIRDLEARKAHPFTFYRKHGYTVVGVIPDATGPGRHDILMAKRLEEESETE